MGSHSELCPVCKGTGKYKSIENCNYTSCTQYIEQTCHGCGGRGWIVITENLLGYDIGGNSYENK